MRSVATLLLLSAFLGLAATSDSSSKSISGEGDDGSEIICQRYNGTFECDEDLIIRIITATYGRSDNTTCPRSNTKRISNTNCSLDAINQVARACDGERRCTLESRNRLAGNPCKDTHKYLNVTYTCEHGEAHQVNRTWTHNYTFAFIELQEHFTTLVHITRKTRDETCIKEPCSATNTCIEGDYFIIQLNTGQCGTISIRSTAEIIVHGIVRSVSNITGGFLALLNDYLDNEYVIDVYTPKPHNDFRVRPQAAITAIHNNTNVTIHCSNNCTTKELLGTTNRELDSSDCFILNESESILLETVSDGTSLTGTLVQADKAISVLVGSMNVEIPETSSGLDHGVIIEQLMPISKWGYVHFVPPFQNATNGWVVRVTAFYENTNVNLVECGDNTTKHTMLNLTHYVDIEIAQSHNPSVCRIISDQPVQVMQYMASSNDTEFGDPSMSLIPPVQNFHGNTTLRVENCHTVKQYVDFITSEHGKDGLYLNGTVVTNFTGYCFNITDELNGFDNLRHILDKKYCYFHTELQNGVYHVTQVDQSEKFLVRLHAHNRKVGGAMLADLSFQNITRALPMDIFTTRPTTTEASDIERRAALAAKLQAQGQGDFESYGAAEEAMTGLTDYLNGKEELGSVNELDFAFYYFTGVLTRKPLKHATADNAKSFLGLSSGAINVLFANQTNKLLIDACVQNSSLTSTPEDAERELEGLMKDAARIIVDGGRQSLNVAGSNAAIVVSSTRLATSSVTATVSSVCEGSLDLNGVSIPCEVLEDLESRATYQINLSYGAEALARSSCEGYNERKSTAVSPLLGVGLVSGVSKQEFVSNITLSFVTTKSKDQLMENNTLCSFWDYNSSNWSTEGCFFEGTKDTSDGTVVTCLCNHLTSFAVLLNVSSTETPPGHEFAMEILSWIGCSLSIIACFLTCFGYTILKLHSDLILIHGNLAVAVGVAEVVFLFLDFNVQYPSIPCTVVAALIYYQFLVMFAWMTIEGVHLYLLTFVVWNAERRKIKYYMACGWGVPVLFLVVLLSVTKGVLGNENVCFLSLDDDDRSLLYFLVPVAIILIFNLFVMIRVVLQIAKMADGPTLQSDVKSRIKHGVKAILVLLPIMGLTWVFAFLAIERASLTFQYIFVILNSFQGVFIFLVHFIRNSEVRHAFKRRRERWLISHSRQGDYRVKNTKKTSSSAAGKTTTMSKTPDQTLTLMNVHTEPSFGGSLSDKSIN